MQALRNWGFLVGFSDIVELSSNLDYQSGLIGSVKHFVVVLVVLFALS